MIAIITLMFLFCIIIPLAFKFFMLFLLPVCLIFLGIQAIGHINSYREERAVQRSLETLTTKVVLDKLKMEEKKKLAYLVDLYLTRKGCWKKNVKADLYSLGLGYTIADIGFTKAVRYSVGYAMLRKLVRKDLYKMMDGE